MSDLSESGQLSFEEVRHLASLCRIGLTDAEVRQMRIELINLLSEVWVVQNVDTLGIEPTGHAAALDSVMREDEPGHTLSLNEVLSNVPVTEGSYIRVQAVLGD